jgi:hypothetical protein
MEGGIRKSSKKKQEQQKKDSLSSTPKSGAIAPADFRGGLPAHTGKRVCWGVICGVDAVRDRARARR